MDQQENHALEEEKVAAELGASTIYLSALYLCLHCLRKKHFVSIVFYK